MAAAAGPHAGMIVFSLLRWYTGQEKLVDAGDSFDLRDKASIQQFERWRQDGDGETTLLTVYPVADVGNCIVWQLAWQFQRIRETLRAWQVRESDTRGCIELHSPSLVDGVADVSSADCPLLLQVEALRESGWSAHDGTVTHDRASRAYSR